MRRTAPLLIVLAAVALYAVRDTVLSPLVPDPPVTERSRGKVANHPEVQSASAVAPSGGAAPDHPTPTAAASSQPGDPSVAASPEQPPSPAPPVRGKIRRNSSLYVELRRVGVTPQQIDGVVRASRKTYNLTRVRTGQKFDVYMSQRGSVDSLFFYFANDRFLGVRKAETGFVASIDTVPYTTTYHVTEATIQHSVFAALQQQGAETDLAAHLAEIFGWTIDFFTDIHPGDSFTVLYENRRYEGGRSQLGEVLAARVVSNGREHYAFRFPDGAGRVGYYDEIGRSLEKSLKRSPVRYTRVTSNFSHRRYHPINKRYQPHYGVDFGAPYGTPVYATGDGTVVAAIRRRANGNYVKIRHNNTYTTYYLHLQRFAKGIRRGAKVRQGQVIGYVGSTGWANGPHVCYRIKRNGSWVNPRRVKLPSKEPVSPSAMSRFETVRDSYLLRLRETALDGVDNHTRLVESPSRPADTQMRAAF